MSVKLLTEHHCEFLSLKGDCTGSSESTLVKMPHCWKSHATAHICNQLSGPFTPRDQFKVPVATVVIIIFPNIKKHIVKARDFSE